MRRFATLRPSQAVAKRHGHRFSAKDFCRGKTMVGLSRGSAPCPFVDKT
jgi:hypothetical protein